MVNILSGAMAMSVGSIGDHILDAAWLATGNSGIKTHSRVSQAKRRKKARQYRSQSLRMGRK